MNNSTHSDKNKTISRSLNGVRSHSEDTVKNGKSNPAKYLLNNFHEPICIFDANLTDVLYANTAFGRLLSISVADCYEKGFREFVSRIEPNDYFVLQNKVIPRLIAYCGKLNGKCEITFSVNYRLRNGNGEYNHILQRTTVADWKQKLPSICINIFTNLSSISNGTSNKITLCIDRLEGNALDTKAAYREEFVRKAAMLSDRERAILRLMVVNKKLDVIATDLHISYHTVRAHCRNMLRKTKCSSQEQLKQLAVSEGWV